MASKWWTLVAVVAGIFMLLVDALIVQTALPSIQADFHASLSDLQWAFDAYLLALAALLLVGGSLGDRFGRRRLFSIGLGVFTFGSLLCGLATGPLFLSLARGVQGIGGAIMYAISLALIGAAFRGRDRGVAFGIYGAATGIALSLGPFLGGAITTGISWRWVFLVNVPIGIATAVVTLTKVAESRDPGAVRVDLFGFLTFGAGLGALVYGLINSADGWTQTKVEVGLGAAGVLLVAFIVGEFAQRRPMLDLSLFRKPTFNGGLIAAFAMSASLFTMITFISIYFQNLLGYGAFAAGLRLMCITAAMFATAILAGRLTTVVPVKLMIGAGFVLVGAGLLWMYGVTAGSHWTELAPGMIVAGLGAGMVNVPLSATAIGVVEPARGGMASGISNTFRQVGLATGIALYGSLFALAQRDGIVDALRHTPYSGRAEQIASGVQAGVTSGPVAPPVVAAIRTGFADALNEILLISGVVALVAAVTSFLFIRARDFVPMPQQQTAPAQQAPSKPASV